MLSRVLPGVGMVIVFAFASSAQSASDTTWETITSSNADFSVSVPAGYFAHSNKRANEVRVWGSSNGAFFDISFRKTGDADEWLNASRKVRSGREETTDFSIGDADIQTFRKKGEKASRYAVYTATRKGYYVVSTTSVSLDNPTLLMILSSIRVGEHQVLKDTGANAPAAATKIKATSLKSSDVIQKALRRRQTEQIEVVAAEAEDSADKAFEEKFYSRRVIILEKPLARYTNEARNNNISGTVRLRVLLKGNGDVGRITAVKVLPFGLTEMAVRAAQGIKFLPAEILGVPADTEVVLEYGFTVF